VEQGAVRGALSLLRRTAHEQSSNLNTSKGCGGSFSHYRDSGKYGTSDFLAHRIFHVRSYIRTPDKFTGNIMGHAEVACRKWWSMPATEQVNSKKIQNSKHRRCDCGDRDANPGRKTEADQDSAIKSEHFAGPRHRQVISDRRGQSCSRIIGLGNIPFVMQIRRRAAESNGLTVPAYFGVVGWKLKQSRSQSRWTWDLLLAPPRRLASQHCDAGIRSRYCLNATLCPT
jgi:hypothetical protein